MKTKQDSALALIRDEESGGWQRLTEPAEIVTSNRADEVLTLLQYIEQRVEEGLTAIGYVAYEAASAFDASLPSHEPATPLLCFALFRNAEPVVLPENEESPDCSLHAAIGKADYLNRVQTIKEHLGAGDCYQVNFTYHLEGELDSRTAQAIDVFAALYQQQPSPHSVFFQCADMTLCCVSPELFFRLDGDRITMEPMKGTRPRSALLSEDQKFRAELLTSEKEKAENLMIVDMVRNDLGKIAKPGSVTVDSLFEIMQLPTLWQQISRVSARTEASISEIFRALFPCASITGAPKRQSMNVIHQLETKPRGIYTGAIGVMQPGRQTRFAVGIRTLVIEEASQRISYGVGSGIVWDSAGESEWQETLHKARILQSTPTFRLLETMRYAPDEGIYLLDFHLQRIAASAKWFGFQIDQSTLSTALQEISFEHPMRVRLLLESCGSFHIETSKLTASPQEVVLGLLEHPIDSNNVFLQHKTTQREIYESAKASAPAVDDVVLWNERGELTETTIYNLFLELNGELLTPALSSGLLAGTLRREMLHTGKAREAVLEKSALNRATAIFVGNSVRGLLPAKLA